MKTYYRLLIKKTHLVITFTVDHIGRGIISIGSNSSAILFESAVERVGSPDFKNIYMSEYVYISHR